jgi:hypothetical protein
MATLLLFCTAGSGQTTVKYSFSYSPASGPIMSFAGQALATTNSVPQGFELAVDPFTVTDGVKTWTITDGAVFPGNANQHDVFWFVTAGYDWNQGDFT